MPFLISVFLRPFSSFLSCDFFLTDRAIHTITMLWYKEFMALAALFCIFGYFQQFFHQFRVVRYNEISEIGTYKIPKTMLYAQRIIPIVIKNTAFIKIVAAMLLDSVLHRVKLLGCEFFDLIIRFQIPT